MNNNSALLEIAGHLWRNGQKGTPGPLHLTNPVRPETTAEKQFFKDKKLSYSSVDLFYNNTNKLDTAFQANPFQMSVTGGSAVTSHSAPNIANLPFFNTQARNLKNTITRAGGIESHHGPLSNSQLAELRQRNPVAALRYEALLPEQQKAVMVDRLNDANGIGEETIIYVPDEGWSSSSQELNSLVNLPDGIREIFVAGEGGSIGGLLGIEQKPGNWYLFGGAIDLGSPQMPGAGTAGTWWIPDSILGSDMSDYFDHHDKEYYGNNDYNVTLDDLGKIFNLEWAAFIKGMNGHIARSNPLGMALQFVYSGATTVHGLGAAVWNSATGAFSSAGNVLSMFNEVGIAPGMMSNLVSGGCVLGGASGSPANALGQILNGGCFGTNVAPMKGKAKAVNVGDGLVVSYVSAADAAQMDALSDCIKGSTVRAGEKSFARLVADDVRSSSISDSFVREQILENVYENSEISEQKHDERKLESDRQKKQNSGGNSYKNSPDDSKNAHKNRLTESEYLYGKKIRDEMINIDQKGEELHGAYVNGEISKQNYEARRVELQEQYSILRERYANWEKSIDWENVKYREDGETPIYEHPDYIPIDQRDKGEAVPVFSTWDIIVEVIFFKIKVVKWTWKILKVIGKWVLKKLDDWLGWK